MTLNVLKIVIIHDISSMDSIETSYDYVYHTYFLIVYF